MKATRSRLAPLPAVHGTLAIPTDSRFPRAVTLWWLAFAYAITASLVFQKLVLPNVPSLHGAHGLLKNDALFFHDAAVELVRRIREEGWAVLDPFSFGVVTGNVKLLAAVYAVFGIDPAWFLPVTCALHALSAVLVYRLGALLWPGAAGQLGGLIAATLFTLSPTSLQWYGQNHKDAFAIAGTLLIVLAWLRCLLPDWRRPHALVRHAAFVMAGAFLVAFVRSYFLQILLAAMLAGTLCAWALHALRREAREGDALSVPRALLPLIVVAAVVVAMPRHAVTELVAAVDNIETPEGQTWTWHPSASLPAPLDRALQKLSTSRAHFAASGQGAGSLVDGDRLPDDAVGAVLYMPRALAIGLLAPFPDTWVERPTIVRLIGAFETFVWYGFLPGLLLLLLRHPTVKLFALLGFAAAALTVLGYAEPVVGTLYRLRFGVWFVVLLAGSVGWAHVVLHVLHRVNGSHVSPAGRGAGAGQAGRTAGLSGVAADGSVVMLLWAFTLVGFLVRDVILVGSEGLGAGLGLFFAAAMVPMFFFAFLSAPMADALTGPFLDSPPEVRRRLVRACLGWSGTVFCVVGAALYVWAEPVMRVVVSVSDPAALREAAELLRWNLPFFVCSGWTVVGAAVLNAGRKSRVVAGAQFAVPVVAIVTFVILGERLGIRAAIYGMLGGMAMNTLIVFVAAARQGYVLLPSLDVRHLRIRALFARYAALAWAALFVAATVPLNFTLAGAVAAEAVPAWAFASKLVQVFTTTVGFAIGAVVLPHLGSLVAARSGGQLRSDTWFLLVAGAWLSAFCALAVHSLAEPVALGLLAGDKVSAAEAVELAGILRIGALQLPFVVSMAVLVKVSAVAGGTWRATVSAAVGLVVNAAAGFLLVPALGVAGVAFAATAGAGMAAITMLLLARRRADLGYREVVLLSALWLGMACLGAAFSAQSFVLAVPSVLTLLIVARMQWTAILMRADAVR